MAMTATMTSMMTTNGMNSRISGGVAPGRPSMALLDEMIREQLKAWSLAASNYRALGATERRPVSIGAMRGALQSNPARIVSTAAKVDKDSLAKRPCFLCAANRPKEQFALPFGDEWEILVNPFPILPFHFTVASRDHSPQLNPPLAMIELAECLPGACVFFNGAGAGASAPDHAHMQIVLAEELPLLRYLEDGGDPSRLPYRVDYDVIRPDQAGMAAMRKFSLSANADAAFEGQQAGMVNAYAWIDADGLLRLLTVPRKAHRPECFYATDESERMLVSPGAIDMAGLIILPRKEDFNRMTEPQVMDIYRQTGIAID